MEGAAASSGAGLQGAPPPLHYVWVGRVSVGDQQVLKKHMKDNGVDVQYVRKVSHEDAMYYAYKVGVSKDDVSKLLNQDFWPIGVWCERWQAKKL